MTTFPGVSGVVLIQHKNTQYKWTSRSGYRSLTNQWALFYCSMLRTRKWYTLLYPVGVWYKPSVRLLWAGMREFGAYCWVPFRYDSYLNARIHTNTQSWVHKYVMYTSRAKKYPRCNYILFLTWWVIRTCVHLSIRYVIALKNRPYTINKYSY